MNEIKIGEHVISPNSKVFIIAEAGVNHNGDIGLAKKLVDEAVRCGADCVKFQTFKAENLVTKKAPKANYQLQVTDPGESQFAMLKKLELTLPEYKELIRYCRDKKITFLSTPYNKEDIDFLDHLEVPAFKVASGQLVELPFLRHMARKKKPMIISTGMSFMADIDEAVRAIRAEGNEQIVLLQCTTNYPSLEAEANLLTLRSIEAATGCMVGYSDHTLNNLCIVASVALGARVIEKHFTLDKKMAGPDHSCSADPVDFLQLIHEVRMVEAALGNGFKAPAPQESKNIQGMRRSLASKVAIQKGEIISEDKIAVKRPATGLEPKFIDRVIGRRAQCDIAEDEILQMQMIEWD